MAALRCLPWVAAGALAAAACSAGIISDAMTTSPDDPSEPCTNEGEVRSCYPGNPATRLLGTCQDGTVTCSAGTWSGCVGYRVAAAEGCDDGLDTNCNGLIDEGCGCEQGDGQPCYTGSPSTVGIGACQPGIQLCVAGLWSSTCEGEVLPSSETCNGFDQDCNGVTDEGCDCGDGNCDGGETCSSCPSDCGACQPSCGDGSCNGGETCSSCPADCGACQPSCGDSSCDGGETCSSCPDDCGACQPTCGDSQCNGGETCSSCPGDCGTCPNCEWGTQGESGDPCTGVPETTWRCVFIPSWGTNGSQICRTDTDCPSPEPCWLTYHFNPADCGACCGSYSSACE